MVRTTILTCAFIVSGALVGALPVTRSALDWHAFERRSVFENWASPSPGQRPLHLTYLEERETIERRNCRIFGCLYEVQALPTTHSDFLPATAVSTQPTILSEGGAQTPFGNAAAKEPSSYEA
ncbi:uncharacterized protein LAESUDRAFT_760253 [Laetiporus sulphureus 93-53]|uniref:Uncharacterized protein n=1 Tax=Laetiporus sulphureus 93-53 TaxID=1314785 RepID=A0A165DQ50_9APHY|nr:uncharacterized protein LAESUDRAFT_760253 [Laetiporus sulphureus 93-53]KZT05379.1 hypothetical protein LAESUDRAFT_760253 [Laetiporus sulphureus 93-53]